MTASLRLVARALPGALRTTPGKARATGLLLMVLAAVCGVARAAEPPDISLLTFAPGEIYWQRFGHNAIVVRDADSGEAWAYNYGIFDFRQKNFFLNFARGRMLYRLDAAPLDWTLRQYAAEGRWAVEQRLALGVSQRRAVADYLAWNVRPENADYRYDYFVTNCSTKARDVIDLGLGGGLRAALGRRPGVLSYRGEVLRLMAPMPALMLGMDLGLGPRVDARLDRWQEGFIPMRLMAALRDVRVDDGAGGSVPLVSSERTLIAAPDPGTREQPPTLWPGGLLAGLALLAVAWLVRRSPPAFGVFALTSLFLFGLAGLVLLLGWAATDHWGMAANHNLLLLHPLWWLLLPAAWRMLRQRLRPPSRFVRVAASTAAAASLLALPVGLFGSQPNLHWVAALLPVELVLLHTLMRKPRNSRPGQARATDGDLL